MRRSIVPLSLLVAAAAIWILGTASPARAIICAQAISHVPPPCCPIPTRSEVGNADLQPICCQPTTCCATGGTTPTCCPSAGCCTPPCVAGTLTISASPNPSKAGTKVVISGGFTGNPQSGASVVLWRKLAGQSSFQQMSQTATDGSGRYAFTLGRGAVMADQVWYVTAGGLKSSTVQQQVNALVGLSTSTRSTRVGHTIRVSGHVTPSHTGEVLLIEARRGTDAWRVIARPHVSRGSTYAVAGQFSRAGAVDLRAVLPGDNRNARSSSPTVTVIVNP